MKCEVIISQLHAIKDEAMRSKMDELTVTQKIKEAINLVSPLSNLCVEQPLKFRELSFVTEFNSFINKTNSSLDRVINRRSDIIFFCNTVFRIVNTYSEVIRFA